MYEARIILILKPQKDTTKRETDGASITEKHGCKNSLPHVRRSVQQYIKRITDHDPSGVCLRDAKRGFSVHK